MTPMVPFSLITKEGTGINSFAFFDETSDLTILGGLLELFGLYSPLCCISSLNLLSVAEETFDREVYEDRSGSMSR